MRELIIKLYGREASTSFWAAAALAALAIREGADGPVITVALAVAAAAHLVSAVLAVRARRVWTDMNKETA
jgi:hypothetical protein